MLLVATVQTEGSEGRGGGVCRCGSERAESASLPRESSRMAAAPPPIASAVVGARGKGVSVGEYAGPRALDSGLKVVSLDTMEVRLGS